HPPSDQHALASVIAEKFTRRWFANTYRSCVEPANAELRDVIEARGRRHKFSGGKEHICILLSFHRRLNGFCNRGQVCILRQVESLEAVAFSRKSARLEFRGGASANIRSSYACCC